MREGRLGILAGRGELPWLAAKHAIAAGEDPIVFCFTSEAPPDEYKDRSVPVILTKLYTSTLKSIAKHGCKRVLLLGKATRDILYDNPRFDLRVILLLASMVNQSDTTLFESVARVVEEKGITILPQDTFLKHLYLREGRYGPSLTRKEMADIEFGMVMAREINRLDLGQTIVCGKKSILAVECAEGTDQCVIRGGNLFRKKGAVVCKVGKTNHDPRFDLPVTGLSTLESMKESGCRVLAIEASQTMVLNHKEFLKKAKEYKITILACNPEKTTVAEIKKLKSRSLNV